MIFDLDDVLVRFRPRRRLEYLARITGLDQQRLHEAIWGSDFEHAAEAGAWPDPDDYLSEFNQRIGVQLTAEQWIAGRRVAMELRPDVLEIARQLQGRVAIALLTNNGSLLKRSLPQLVPEICQVFAERAHASYEFNARKPEPAVFRRLLERYDVDPTLALHIDDDADYVKGAIAAGLHGYAFRDADSLNSTLRDLLSRNRGKLPMNPARR